MQLYVYDWLPNKILMFFLLRNGFVVDEREIRYAANGRSTSPGGLSLNIPPRRTYLRGSASPNSSFNHPTPYQSSPPVYHPVSYGQAQEVSGAEFSQTNGAKSTSSYAQPPQYSEKATPPSNFFNQRPMPTANPFNLSGRMATPPAPAPPIASYFPPSHSSSSPLTFGRATPPSNLFNSQRRGAPPPSSLFTSSAKPNPSVVGFGQLNVAPMHLHQQHFQPLPHSTQDNAQESTTPTNTTAPMLPLSLPPAMQNGSEQHDPHSLRNNLHINLPPAKPRRVASPSSLSLPFTAAGRPGSPGSISLPSRTPVGITTPSPGGFSLGGSPLSLNIPGRPGSAGKQLTDRSVDLKFLTLNSDVFLYRLIIIL